jgi:hypothetical protein
MTEVNHPIWNDDRGPKPKLSPDKKKQIAVLSFIGFLVMIFFAVAWTMDSYENAFLFTGSVGFFIAYLLVRLIVYGKLPFLKGGFPPKDYDEQDAD